ncbi:MAG TPA: hypothetical protein VJP06_06945 [Thermoplasmata archaeon]|nr:hypothetical protein [Thermoplasmata archaeon]
MHEAKVPGVGFLKATKARNAEAAIGQSEGLVTVLRLTQTDLKPAEEALKIARQFFEAHHYSKAFQAAKKAETLAIALDGRFSGYKQAARALQSRLVSMKRLGLPTESLETTLRDSEEKVMAGIWENGFLVPNYVEARAMVERAEHDGSALQEKAQHASNAIFMAELATEALIDIQGPVDPTAFSKGVASDLEMAIHDATKELAMGNPDGAAKIAGEIERKATRLRTMYFESFNTLNGMEGQLADLRGEGILTERIEGQVKIAKDILGKGLIESASAMASQLAADAKTLGIVYHKVTTGLADAELLYSRLEREGFHSYEADASIRDARKAIREGTYARAIEHLGRAHRAFVQRTNARKALAKSIEETRARVKLLQGVGLSFLPDIQEVLGRAEREFTSGNFSGSSEDLRIATVLLDKVTETPLAKK